MANMSYRPRWKDMNPYEVHKMIINEYFLKARGDTKLLKRDSSSDKRDKDVLMEYHKFLWDDVDEDSLSWGEKFAKKYYDRLYKEYCIADLTFYKENKIGMRWRTESELVAGKGQFSCGGKYCSAKETLKSWEVNFAYKEQGEKKNALVKLRLCPECSNMLNYRFKRKEVKRLKNVNQAISETSSNRSQETEPNPPPPSTSSQDVWQDTKNYLSDKSKESEVDVFLEDLFL